MGVFLLSFSISEDVVPSYEFWVWRSSDLQEIFEKQAVSYKDMTKIIYLSKWYDCKIPPKEWKNKLSKSWYDSYSVINNKEYNFDIENKEYYCFGYPLYRWYLDSFFSEDQNISNNIHYKNLVSFVYQVLKDKSDVYQKIEWLDSNDDLRNCLESWCNLKNFDATWNNYFDKWLIILDNLGIVESSLSIVENINSNVSWEKLFDVAVGIREVSWSSLDTDYSGDGVLNHNDNCPYHYNPNQQDTSGDWVWDVCSSDIDWDWNLNPIWIVNNQWNINFDKKYIAGAWYFLEDWQLCKNYVWDVQRIEPEQNCFDIDTKIWTESSFNWYNEEWVGVTSSSISSDDGILYIYDGSIEIEYEDDVVFAMSNQRPLQPDNMYFSDFDENVIVWYDWFEFDEIQEINWFLDWEKIIEDKRMFRKNFDDVWKKTIWIEVVTSDWVNFFEFDMLVQNVWEKWNYEPFEIDVDEVSWYHLSIDADNQSITQWDTINFQVNTNFEYDEIEWDFGDGSYWYWTSVENVYSDAGKFNVVARWKVDGEYVSSALINVFVESEKKYSSLQISCERSTWIVECNAFWENVDEVVWRYDNVEEEKDIHDSFVLEWNAYEDFSWQILALWKYDWDQVAESNSFIEENYRSYIYINEDQAIVWERFDIMTDMGGFDQDDIDVVEWNLNGDFRETDSVDISWIFDEYWEKYIQQNIYLQDGSVLSNSLSLFVQESWLWVSPFQIQSDLVLSTFSSNVFSLDFENIDYDYIDKIRWDFWDKNTIVDEDISEESMEIEYWYNLWWNYDLKVFVYTQSWDVLTSSINLYVQWQDFCDGDVSQLSCDMSGDGVPDLCSNDISGDWFENVDNLIVSEPEERDDDGNCVYEEEHININALKQQAEMANNFQEYDVCPFDDNPNQTHWVGDWIGDECRWLADMLDDVEENFHEPDFNNELYIDTVNVLSCPAHYADFESTLWRWDTIRAVLYDQDLEKVYSVSNLFDLDEDVGVLAPDVSP